METIGAYAPAAFISSFCAVLSDIEFVAVQIRELLLELGSKNGVLKAMKLELMVSLIHLQADEF